MMLVLAIVEIFSVILQRIFCDSTLEKEENSQVYRLSGMGRIFCGLQRCYICFNVSGRWHE